MSGALDINPAHGISDGSAFTILDKSSTGAITGAISGQPQGNVFPAGGYYWQISCTGENGNVIGRTAVIAQQGSPADSFDADDDSEDSLLEFATA